MKKTSQYPVNPSGERITLPSGSFRLHLCVKFHGELPYYYWALRATALGAPSMQSDPLKARKPMTMTLNCPGCRRRYTITSGGKYMVCERCSTPHCIYCGSKCKVSGCPGWMDERRHN